MTRMVAGVVALSASLALWLAGASPALPSGWSAPASVKATAATESFLSAQQGPVALHLRYRLLARGVWSLISSGRYVGYTRPFERPPGAQPFTLLDDSTGKGIAAGWPSTDVAGGPSCGPVELGAPWVGFDCAAGPGPRFRFYDLQTRKWRRIACDARCQNVYDFAELGAVGAKWFALRVDPHDPCGDGVHGTCGPTTYLYYNVATGKPGHPRPASDAIIDLNSRTLTRPLCAPLQLPAGSYPSSFPSPLRFFGHYALAQESTGIYLERCGSHLHMPLVQGSYIGQVIGNTQAVAFCADPPGQSSGIRLRSLKRFTFTLPSSSWHAWGAAVLRPRHLYVLDTQRHMLWIAALGDRSFWPRPPKAGVPPGGAG